MRQNEVIADETLSRMLPVLVTATGHVGHHQTRNRGTIGGSIALGEPAAELPATAVALGAIDRSALRARARAAFAPMSCISAPTRPRSSRTS